MKKEELRIGIIMFDSVRQKEVTLELKHFKELEIAETNFFDRYKRIILDATWLEKFGFQFCIENSFSNGIIEVKYSNLEHQCYVYNGFQLDYVHQLQNIYFSLNQTELILKKDNGF